MVPVDVTLNTPLLRRTECNNTATSTVLECSVNGLDYSTYSSRMISPHCKYGAIHNEIAQMNQKYGAIHNEIAHANQFAKTK